MKKILLILTVISSSLVISSCRKDDNPKLPDLVKAPIPVFTLHEDSQELRIIDPDTYTNTFDFGLYFPEDTQPAKADIVAALNGNYEDVKVLKADITTFPVTVSVTGSSLAELFGLAAADLEEGTIIELRARFTLSNGTVLPAFSEVGEQHSSDLKNLPGSALTLKYQVPCELIISEFSGEFEVVTDEWQDFSPGDIVTVDPVDDTHFSFKYAAPDAQPIIIQVDPETFATSVAKQYSGSYGPGYDFSVESVAGNKANFIETCDKIISVRLTQTTPADNYGDYTIVLKKVVTE